MNPANREEIAVESGQTANYDELKMRGCVKFNDPRIGSYPQVVCCDALAFLGGPARHMIGRRGQSFITSFSLAAAISLTLPSVFLVSS